MKSEISGWIIENNHQYVVVRKPGGVPSQSDKTNDSDLLNAVRAYTKTDLKLVNRLDRPVSGCILLSKSDGATRHFAKSNHISKTYLALIHPTLPTEQDTVKVYLGKGPNNKAYVSDMEKKGFKEARLSYRLLHNFDKYQLVEIVLQSGRFHQIRAILAHIGCPVKGDVKYGARRSNPDRTIGLHAWKLSLDHPVHGKMEHYTATLPDQDKLWQLAQTIIESKS